MSKCIEKIKHEECGGSGLQVFSRDDGTVDGYCFTCATYVRHPYGEETQTSDVPVPAKKTEEEVALEMAEILGYPVVSLPSRKLKAESLDYFGVKVSMSTDDGKTPTASYFPYTREGKIVGYKAKTLSKPKQTWVVGSMSEVDLFGWEQAIKSGAKRLIIVEGEEDAVALKQIIDKHTKKDYEDYKPAVVSLQFGVSSAKTNLGKVAAKIRRHFSEYVLCFDNDKPGEEAVKHAHQHLPTAVRATLPCKDANECILKGATKAAFNAVQFRPASVKNTRLVSAKDLFEKAAEPPKFGELSWPWESVNDTTRGIRYGETIYIGAGAKMGKSEIADFLAGHFIKNGHKVFMAKPEQAGAMTVKRIAGKIVGRIFHDPKIPFDEKAYRKATEIIDDNLTLLDLYQHIGWKTLVGDIKDAAFNGHKIIFIDPITNLTNGIDPSTANTLLQEIAQELSSMALDLELAIFLFCHLKSPDGNLSNEARSRLYNRGEYIGLGNCPHEVGGSVYSSQFAGSRAMMRSCNYMFGLEGNKDPNLPDEKRNIRHFTLLEDREFGETGVFPLYWNENTGLFEEIG